MKLDARRQTILNYLLDYRGMNAKQMTAFIYMTPYYTASNLAQVQRDLKRLTDNGFVTKFAYKEDAVDEDGIIKKQNVSMYHLTATGYTYMLNLYDVLPGQLGSGFLLGFLQDNEFIYGDIKYETHSPPKKLVDHHLMAIDAFIQMSIVNKPIPHRNNLYAAKKIDGNKRLRPDAEALVNGKIYFLEFDRYTENHEKLVEKFFTYASYFDTLNDDEKSKLGKIIFVVNDSNGKNRRWNNILAAYLKGISDYLYVPLVMCDVNELNVILWYESDQKLINDDIKKYASSNSNEVWISRRDTKVNFVISEKSIQLVTFLYQYDSTLFNRLHTIFYKTNKENLNLNHLALLISPNSLYHLKLNLEHYNVPQIYLDLYKYYEKKMNKKLIRYPSMVLDEIRIDEIDDYYDY